MPPDLICPRCGEPLPRGEPDCPYCAGLAKVPLHHHQSVVIAGVVLIAAVLWVVTHYVTRAYAAHESQLSQQWFERGAEDLKAGRLEQAVRELQTALSYSRENFQYRLRLAQALEAEGRRREARAHLLALWEQEPGNGVVNLQLARLEAEANSVGGALRYYHGAIYGVWDNDARTARREARIELVQFLLAHRQIAQAQSEIIGVAADLPPRPKLMIRVAGLMTEAGDNRRALELYRDVLALEPDNTEALAGAGKASFTLQMYSAAREYLRRALAAHTQDEQAIALLQTAELVLRMDPFERHLSAAERERRIIDAFAAAGKRLQQCAGARSVALGPGQGNSAITADHSTWTSLQPAITAKNLRRKPEQGDAAMEVVARIERDATKVCGTGSPEDQALLLIAERRDRSMP